MRRLQQLSLGWFQCPLHDGELFDFELDETVHPVYGRAKGETADAVKWFRALQTAWVTRNQKAIDFLMSIDFKTVLSVTSFKDTMFTTTAALYRKLQLQHDIRDALLECQFSPSTLDGNPAKLDRAELLLLPPIDVIATIAFEEGEARFNQAIENALLQHQRYYKKDPDIATPDTALSMPLMGLAALAYDRLGYRVTVENRYIPQWLVEHQDWSQLPPLADDSLRLNFPVRTRNPLEK
ncbi:immunity 49 family protein [Bacterioplanes sanyensis]|uniref:immunity 49 family protein n=1 Tax=Bacterioplanes sanyensis TaxID=1249553 RepID=UPI0016725786|nr:immunity 49 family protein [Bacterioplanes sanyensis]